MYYENHVTLEQSESYHTDHGRRMEWHCFLCGERIGTIEYFSNRCTWEKHYESLVYCDNQRMKHVVGMIHCMRQSARCWNPPENTFENCALKQNRRKWLPPHCRNLIADSIRHHRKSLESCCRA